MCILYVQVERKANTVYNDILETDGNKTKLVEVVKDVQGMELCDTFDHQQILVSSLIEKVIERKDKDRIGMSHFLFILADQIKQIDFDTM